MAACRGWIRRLSPSGPPCGKAVLAATAFVLLSQATCTVAATRAETSRYPERPVRIIVPFAPGGGADFVARIMAQRLGEAWNQAVVVENRGGGSTTIGTDLVAKASPDGYTMGIVTAEHAIVPSIFKRMPFHPVRDFAPITQTVTQTYILTLNPSIPATTVNELIGHIRSRKDGINFGTANWSVGHLAGELFKLRAGLKMTHIPYKGGGLVVIDLLAGQVSLMFATPPTVMPNIKAGRLRAIATTSAKRSSLLPDLPTVAESGLPGFEATGWNGFLVPAKTPKEMIARLNQDMVRVLALPDVQDRMTRTGVEPVGGTPAEFGAYIAREIDKWAKVVKDANLDTEQ
jgi:tripartite-type tricarboxylate transporter receptor subunit TctC